MSDCLSVFVTAASRDEAQSIAHAVVNEKLAACANIFPGVTSVYRWQGNVEQAEETALVLKTTAAKFEALQARIRQLHSYECPCIVGTKIVAGSADYLNWIAAQV